MYKKFIFTLFTVSFMSGYVYPDSGTNLDREAVEEIVKNYILENPELIEQAQQLLSVKREQEKAEQARLVLENNRDLLFNAPFTPTSGNLAGDVALVEFFDYQCGYCKRVMKDTSEAVRDDGNVKMVYKEFPILGDTSVYAAKAGLATKMLSPDLYESFHLAVMGFKGRLTENAINKVAEKLGVDVQEMTANLDHPDIIAEIDQNYQLARQLGIDGTPGFVIGDQIIPGAVSRQALDEAIANARR